MDVITRQITLDETNMALINEKMIAANAQNTQQNATSTAGVTSTGTKTKKSDTKHTEFVDDFNGNSINTQYWIPSGDVVVGNGNLKISQSKTDKDMSVTTQNISLQEHKTIVVERKFYSHRNNNYYSGGYDIFLNGNKEEYIGIHDYHEAYIKAYGVHLTYKLRNDKDGKRIQLCDATFDKWITDKTVFDLNTGTITYYIDDKLVSTQKVSGFSPQNIKFFNIRFQSYGWYTGHYTNYDYIRISTK